MAMPQPVIRLTTPVQLLGIFLGDSTLPSQHTAAQQAMGTCLAGFPWGRQLAVQALRRSLDLQSSRRRQQRPLTQICLAGLSMATPASPYHSEYHSRWCAHTGSGYLHEIASLYYTPKLCSNAAHHRCKDACTPCVTSDDRVRSLSLAHLSEVLNG